MNTDAVESRPMSRFRVAHERDVLEALRSRGPLTRKQLQAATGLSRTTLHDIIVRLRTEGAVADERVSSGGKGRPSSLLVLQETAAHLIGLEIGRRHLGVVISNLSHQVVHELDTAMPGTASATEIARFATRIVREMLEDRGLSDARLTAAVIGLPLSLALGDDQASLRAHIGDAFHREFGVTPIFENNARLVALAEGRWGAAQDASDFLYAHLDSGVGGALIMERRLFAGPAGNAGEIGHVCQDVDGPSCWCGSKGCLERYVALPELLQAAGVDDVDALTAADRFAAVRPRMTLMARTLAGLLTALDMHTVVLGGAVAHVDGVMDSVLSDLRQLVPSRIGAELEVRIAVLGALGSARGAIMLGLDTEAATSSRPRPARI